MQLSLNGLVAQFRGERERREWGEMLFVRKVSKQITGKEGERAGFSDSYLGEPKTWQNMAASALFYEESGFEYSAALLMAADFARPRDGGTRSRGEKSDPFLAKKERRLTRGRGRGHAGKFDYYSQLAFTKFR